MEVAFTVVDPPQRVVGAIESQKFDNSAFPSHERSLVGCDDRKSSLMASRHHDHLSLRMHTSRSLLPLGVLLLMRVASLLPKASKMESQDHSMSASRIFSPVPMSALEFMVREEPWPSDTKLSQARKTGLGG
jgi:hypothetical protein